MAHAARNPLNWIASRENGMRERDATARTRIREKSAPTFEMSEFLYLQENADVAKLADALDLGSSSRKGV